MMMVMGRGRESAQPEQLSWTSKRASLGLRQIAIYIERFVEWDPQDCRLGCPRSRREGHKAYRNIIPFVIIPAVLLDLSHKLRLCTSLTYYCCSSARKPSCFHLMDEVRFLGLWTLEVCRIFASSLQKCPPIKYLKVSTLQFQPLNLVPVDHLVELSV